MAKAKASDVWLEWCPKCKRKHYVTMRKCLSCNTYETPQPISDKVWEECYLNMSDFNCDGCQEYRGHNS